jgi:predicted phage terminase large subunit-like protein
VNKKEAAIELLRRRKARTCLHSFIQYMNPEYIVSDFSREVCRCIDVFLVEMMAGKRPILVLGAPPQHGKSDIVSRYLPAYFFGKFPDQRVAGLSYGKDLASDMNRDVQRIMMGEEYAIIFPESSLNKKRVAFGDVESKRNSETFEIQDHKGSYVAQGIGGPLTGKKVDLGIIDDPIKNAKEALSQTTKTGLWNWYVSTFSTRLSKNSGQIIMATRWAEDDLSGQVLAKSKNATSLVFPATNEEETIALVPELHPLEKLLETKALMGEYFWSAMYMQAPTAIGGDMFKGEHWKYYTVLPKIVRKLIFGDTALKTGEKNDYSVLQCWGESYEGAIYLIDQVRGKWEAPELEANTQAFYNKHRNLDGCVCSGVYIEDKASGIGLIQTMKRKGMPIVGIPRSTDKITRMHCGTPLIEAGNVYLPEEAPWLSDYLGEFAAAPNGANDDQIDPTLDAIETFLGGAIFTNYASLI